MKTKPGKIRHHSQPGTLIDWLIDWLTDWLTDRSIDWLTGWLMALWLIDWLITERSTFRLIDWLVDLRVEFFDWLIDRSGEKMPKNNTIRTHGRSGWRWVEFAVANTSIDVEIQRRRHGGRIDVHRVGIHRQTMPRFRRSMRRQSADAIRVRLNTLTRVAGIFGRFERSRGRNGTTVKVVNGNVGTDPLGHTTPVQGHDGVPLGRFGGALFRVGFRDVFHGVQRGAFIFGPRAGGKLFRHSRHRFLRWKSCTCTWNITKKFTTTNDILKFNTHKMRGGGADLSKFEIRSRSKIKSNLVWKGMEGDGRRWKEMQGNGGRCKEMQGDAREWRKMQGNGGRWKEMEGDGGRRENNEENSANTSWIFHTHRLVIRSISRRTRVPEWPSPHRLAWLHSPNVSVYARHGGKIFHTPGPAVTPSLLDGPTRDSASSWP